MFKDVRQSIDWIGAPVMNPAANASLFAIVDRDSYVEVLVLLRQVGTIDLLCRKFDAGIIKNMKAGFAQ